MLQNFVARLAHSFESLLLRISMSQQKLVSHSEVKAIFGGYYPDDVWRLFSEMPESATRAEALDVLRTIAARNHCGARFAKHFGQASAARR